MILYDFLYIDHERVKSLYSQLYSGLLDAMESVAEKSTGKSTSLQVGGDPFGSAKKDATSSVNESKSERLDPHDLILRDVLQGLADNEFINEQPGTAVQGNLILLSGDLTVLNYESYSVFADIIPSFMQQPDLPPRLNKEHKKALQNHHKQEQEKYIAFIKAFTKIVPWSVQVLMESGSVIAWGSIHQDNLRATHGSLLLSHGPQLQGNWYMLAIVDAVGRVFVADADRPKTIEGLTDAGVAIQQAFGRPEEYIGVTPLLIFRKLGKS